MSIVISVTMISSNIISFLINNVGNAPRIFCKKIFASSIKRNPQLSQFQKSKAAEQFLVRRNSASPSSISDITMLDSCGLKLKVEFRDILDNWYQMRSNAKFPCQKSECLYDGAPEIYVEAKECKKSEHKTPHAFVRRLREERERFPLGRDDLVRESLEVEISGREGLEKEISGNDDRGNSFGSTIRW